VSGQDRLSTTRITQVIMNRIQPRKLPAKSGTAGKKLSPSAGSPAVAAGILSRSDAVESSFALFTPLHYERNYAYPLIVWLHGPADSEDQLKRIMPFVSMRNYVAIAPRGTAPSETASAAFHWLQSDEHIEAALQRVLDCLAAARHRFNVAPGRVFLAGHECGGTMAWRLAMREPRHFAGVMSLGGRFPTGQAPLAQLDAARRLSAFVACNRASRCYPTEAVCDDLRLLHSAGMSIMLREYPGVDGLLPQMLADMDRWLMDQITGGIAAVAPSTSSQPGPR
jgi:phospholipase/carboxylesterase